MRVYKVTLTDAMSDALMEQAASEGQAMMRSGPTTIIRKALRYHLAKYGRRATLLDLDDAEYHSSQRIAGEAVPDGRNVVSE